MTHNDIYTKFMIEYDKANITSSYPSLTKYEIATILDKAYLALIAQKLTGNNSRKATLEADVKAIEDVRGLISHDKETKINTSSTILEFEGIISTDLNITITAQSYSGNTEGTVWYDSNSKRFVYKIAGIAIEGGPDTSTYYNNWSDGSKYNDSSDVYVIIDDTIKTYYEKSDSGLIELANASKNVAGEYNNIADNELIFNRPTDMLYYISATCNSQNGTKYTVILVNHELSLKFKVTASNFPWIKDPLLVIDEDELHLLIDAKLAQAIDNTAINTLYITYIKTPNKFVDTTSSNIFSTSKTFELDDSMAEELINLAITMALETVESTRLSTKVSLNPLES